MPSLASADAPGVRVVHHVPGLMRVHVDGPREASAMLHRLQPLLADLPHAAISRVSPASGSVVIRYATASKPAQPGMSPKWGARSLTRQLLVPIAIGAATRLVLPRRRGAPFLVDLTLLALDTVATLKRVRGPRHRTP